MRMPKTVVVGFALFAMFFGAGNLIFPVMIGADAGLNVLPTTIGFLITGVALPVLGMLVVSTASDKELEGGGVPSRIGKTPGLIFTLAIFLSTGMLYAVPRVATVTHEMAVMPFIKDAPGSDSLKLFLFTAVFFAIVTYFIFTPSRVVERVGGYLTPALLIFLALLIIVTLFSSSASLPNPSEKYASVPVVTGIIDGYFTMDALASFVFGFIIISELKERGYIARKDRVSGMLQAGLIAGGCLALVYVGLSAVGTRKAGAGFENGAALLAAVAGERFGAAGQLIFSLIVFLACLTTAIGLLSSSTEYFSKLLPKVNKNVLIVVQILVSMALANLGLNTILKVVAPLNQLIYPIAIVIIVLSLLALALPFRLNVAYKAGAAVAAVFALLEALYLAWPDAFTSLRVFLDHFPAGQIQMGWLVPSVVALLIGIAVDYVRRSAKAPQAKAEVTA